MKILPVASSILDASQCEQQSYFLNGGSLDEVTKVFNKRFKDPENIEPLKQHFSYCIEQKLSYYQKNIFLQIVYFILSLLTIDPIHRASKALTQCNENLRLNKLVESNPERTFAGPQAEPVRLNNQAAFELFSGNQVVDLDD